MFGLQYLDMGFVSCPMVKTYPLPRSLVLVGTKVESFLVTPETEVALAGIVAQ